MNPNWRQWLAMVAVILPLSAWLAFGEERLQVLGWLGWVGAAAFLSVAVLTVLGTGVRNPRGITMVLFFATWGVWMVYAASFVTRGITLSFEVQRGLYSLMGATGVLAVLLFPWATLWDWVRDVVWRIQWRLRSWRRRRTNKETRT